MGQRHGSEKGATVAEATASECTGCKQPDSEGQKTGEKQQIPTGDELLAEARATFGNDRFATRCCGATVDEAWPGHAVCSFEIADHHRNALGAVMGGAIFTLADFACAVASNLHQQPAVTATSDIQYLTGARGTRLIATCDAERDGRRLSFYTTRVTDDTGTLVALVHATCARL